MNCWNLFKNQFRTSVFVQFVMHAEIYLACLTITLVKRIKIGWSEGKFFSLFPTLRVKFYSSVTGEFVFRIILSDTFWLKKYQVWEKSV